HAMAASRAAAARDREMPTVLAALDAVRAELREAGIGPSDNSASDREKDAEKDGEQEETEKPAFRSGNGDSS
ncbi:MAG: hypothetical protein ACXVX6_00820, partial [Mycobacterium sp.]